MRKDKFEGMPLKMRKMMEEQHAIKMKRIFMASRIGAALLGLVAVIFVAHWLTPDGSNGENGGLHIMWIAGASLLGTLASFLFMFIAVYFINTVFTGHLSPLAKPLTGETGKYRDDPDAALDPADVELAKASAMVALGNRILAGLVILGFMLAFSVLVMTAYKYL